MKTEHKTNITKKNIMGQTTDTNHLKQTEVWPSYWNIIYGHGWHLRGLFDFLAVWSGQRMASRLRDLGWFIALIHSPVSVFRVHSRHFVGYLCSSLQTHIIHSARKGPFCSLRLTQANISWYGPALSAYRHTGHCNIWRRTEKAQIRLHGCACWLGHFPSLSIIWLKWWNCI